VIYMRKKGDVYGAHRVIEPVGYLPQQAIKLDNSLPIYSNEILIDVEYLLITSTAFRRIKEQCHSDISKMKHEFTRIVDEKGKFQDPVTGSGGMLTGTIREIGVSIQNKVNVKKGDKIATLVSLSLTPLKIKEIQEINLNTGHLKIEGYALLFEKGLCVKLPNDLPENLAVALMDIAGAPAMTAKTVVMGQNVIVFGAGKAGLLCLYEAMKRVGPTGKVICVEYDSNKVELVKTLNLAHQVIQIDATKPLEVLERVKEALGGDLADVSINCVNVPDTEMATIISTKDSGIIYFFSMSTTFSKAALGAEGAGKSVKMLIGNGYTEGHAELAFQIMRENEKLKEAFKKYFV